MNSIAGFVDGVLIEIYERAVKDEKKSEKQGHPIFNSLLYIKKKVPNSRDLYDQPVKSTDRGRYPLLFEALEKGQEAPLEGTPIEQWPALDVSQVETLRSVNIFTVQAMADLSESGLHRLPPDCRNLKPKAKKWLNQGMENETLQKENAKLLKRIEALEKKVA